MSKVIINGGSGGTGSDECTAKLSDIPTGLKAVTADSNDEAGVGTMPDRGNWSAGDLAAGASVAIPAGKHGGVGKVTARSLAAQTSATAAAAQIRSGYSAWVNGQLVWGSLNIQSAINFSAAVVSGTQIKIRWQNPSRGPWEGVFIQMSTGGYPGSSGGSRVYTGTGSNAAASGWSEVTIGGLALGTAYYFTCTSYVNALGWGNSYNVSATTAASQAVGGLPISATGYGARCSYIQITVPAGAKHLSTHCSSAIKNESIKAGGVLLTESTEAGVMSGLDGHSNGYSIYGKDDMTYTFDVSKLVGYRPYLQIWHTTKVDYVGVANTLHSANFTAS